MKDATIVYPHQLFQNSPALDSKRPVYLVEESLILTHNPIHTQKLIFHKLSLDAYQAKLEQRGFVVTRLAITEYPSTESTFSRLRHDGIEQMHIIDTTDCYLENAIIQSGIARIWYESPQFILSKTDTIERYHTSKRSLARFYQKLRRDKYILVDTNGEPAGGMWSFDKENRHKLPKIITLPRDISLYNNTAVTAACAWARDSKAESYGATGCWLPYTHETAAAWFQEFLHDRFNNFGAYEDALSTQSVRLFHSTLSPLLNSGLLTPTEVLNNVSQYATKHNTPLNSVEGFVRQVLGWREFIRAAYECDGTTMRTRNFWQHEKSLPAGFWSGQTKIAPLDIAINRALTYGYNHHIERLMVLGNFMLLSQTHPDEVYRWFMAMYLDAYDWVMVPNVYGMSQFADGGLFATKPYISGSNYVKKMSDYSTGAKKNSWEELWTALYWNFIATHSTFLTSNHRLSMMPRLLEKMDTAKRDHYLKVAREYLAHNS